MKVLKTVRLNVICAFALVLCIVCSMGAACTPAKKSATYIRLGKEETTIYVGETLTLTVQTDGITGVVWSSDAEHIATVEDGVVTAVAAGEATVKARVDSVRAYCDITVLEKQPDPVDPAPVDPNPVDPDPVDPNPVDPDPIDPDPVDPDPIDPDPVDPKPPVREGNVDELYGDYFKIGAAVQTGKLTNNSYGNLMDHFNSISPENNMKWKNLESEKGVLNFNKSGDSPDKLIEWANKNNVGVRGHCLLWYKSLPVWLHDEFYGKGYSDELKNKAYGYIDGHIEDVMKHFGDSVYVWDVVNEALFNSVSQDKLTVSSNKPYGNIWRTNDNMSATDTDWVDWFKVCGGYEYIASAFKKADEVRKANGYKTELYYNDYGLNDPNKRQACLNLLKMLRDNNAPIDGIGMQAHYKLDDFTANKTAWINNFEASVKAFINAGVDVQITELDIRFDGELTAQREADQAEMYGKIFKVCRKYAKKDGVEHGITGVTFWGVHDGCNAAWGNNASPLIFGRDKLPKKAYYEIINF